MIWEHQRWPNFKMAEFQCSFTGDCEMRPEFLDALQALRVAYGVAMVINSGYRAATHPVEAKKARPGAHNMGIAADIKMTGDSAVRLVGVAAAMGFTGIGFSHSFVHLDMRTRRSGLVCRKPFSWWTY